MNKSIKTISTIMGILLVHFGLFGFLFVQSMTESGPPKLFDDQKPLYDIMGIFVDSAGNLYYGNGEYDSIQVYNNEGTFLYRFSFPTGGRGYYVFYIDEYDIVHVETARTEKVFSFKDGELVGERRSGEPGIINDFENRQKEEFLDNDENKYVISGRSVKMYDRNGTFIRTIKPNTPLWPFSTFIYWSFGALGGVMIYIPNRKFFKGVSELFKNDRNRMK